MKTWVLLALTVGAGACTEATEMGTPQPGQDMALPKRFPTTFSANALTIVGSCSTWFNEMTMRPATISKNDKDFNTKLTSAQVYQCDRTWDFKIPDYRGAGLSLRHLYDLQFSMNKQAERGVYYEASVLLGNETIQRYTGKSNETSEFFPLTGKAGSGDTLTVTLSMKATVLNGNGWNGTTDPPQPTAEPFWTIKDLAIVGY